MWRLWLKSIFKPAVSLTDSRPRRLTFSHGPTPLGADVITLGHILVDWSDDNCRKILRNCFEALPSQGALLVIESVLNNDFSGKKFAMMLDILLLLLCEPGARERSEAEHRSLLEEAGFQSIEVIRLEGPRDLIVARKP